MASISKVVLSGSTNGKLIQVTTTTTPYTAIHTAVASTTSIDEVYLWAINTSASDVLLTLLWGGTTTADSIVFTIPSRVGLVEVVSKQLLRNGLVINAYAATGSVINIGGYVNRIA